jgi:hypothetical protein
MIKKLFILIIIAGIFWYDWKILGEIIEKGADLEIKYFKLFGSVSILTILLYILDREH